MIEPLVNAIEALPGVLATELLLNKPAAGAS